MVTALELATAVAVAMAAVNGPGGEAEGDRPEVEIERCAASKSFAIKKFLVLFMCCAYGDAGHMDGRASRAPRAGARRLDVDRTRSTIG